MQSQRTARQSLAAIDYGTRTYGQTLAMALRLYAIAYGPMASNADRLAYGPEVAQLKARITAHVVAAYA
jgi:hypothetical protein